MCAVCESRDLERAGECFECVSRKDRGVASPPTREEPTVHALRGEDYSYPADVWSLGLTLLTCALGRFPIDLHDRGGGGQGQYWQVGSRRSGRAAAVGRAAAAVAVRCGRCVVRSLCGAVAAVRSLCCGRCGRCGRRAVSAAAVFVCELAAPHGNWKPIAARPTAL